MISRGYRYGLNLQRAIPRNPLFAVQLGELFQALSCGVSHYILGPVDRGPL
jgi:hypothetical protein